MFTCGPKDLFEGLFIESTIRNPKKVGLSGYSAATGSVYRLQGLADKRI